MRLVIIRGLPGSGKTTYAARNFPNAYRVSADDFFTGADGVYRFDPSKIAQAHAACQGHVLHALNARLHPVVVHNTFTQRWEFSLYLYMAAVLNVPVTVRDLYDGGLTDEELAARCVHGVPVAAIAAMRARYER